MRSKSVIDKAIRDSLIDFNSVNDEEDDIGDVDESLHDLGSSDEYENVQVSSPFHISIAKRVQRSQSDVRISDKVNPLYCKKMEEYLMKYYIPFAPLWTGMLLGICYRVLFYFC